MAQQFPPNMPTTLLKTIPSYLYEQFFDDDSLQAFVSVYNKMAQGYIDWDNGINLPIYTNSQITGSLLDWVGQTIWGLPRPSFSSGVLSSEGEYNTVPYNTIEYDGTLVTGVPQFITASDDIYKRTLTWHHYRDDGKYFHTRWLKRRIQRFLFGVNGTSPDIAFTENISVSYVSGNTVNISIVTSGSAQNGIAQIMAAGVSANILELPFGYTFNFTIT